MELAGEKLRAHEGRDDFANRPSRRGWSTDRHLGLPCIEGGKKGEADNMIPMRVGEEERRREAPGSPPRNQGKPQVSNPGTGIADKEISAKTHLNTRRISSIFRCLGPGNGDGPPRPPKTDGDFRHAE